MFQADSDNELSGYDFEQLSRSVAEQLEDEEFRAQAGRADSITEMEYFERLAEGLLEVRGMMRETWRLHGA